MKTILIYLKIPISSAYLFPEFVAQIVNRIKYSILINFWNFRIVFVAFFEFASLTAIKEAW